MLNKSEKCDAILTGAFKTDGITEVNAGAEKRNVLISGTLGFVSRDQTQ